MQRQAARIGSRSGGFAPSPSKPSKDYQRRSGAHVRLCRHRFLSSGQLFSRFCQKVRQ
jgi:hypothetical protein